jgi:hypothetical protein
MDMLQASNLYILNPKTRNAIQLPFIPVSDIYSGEKPLCGRNHHVLVEFFYYYAFLPNFDSIGDQGACTLLTI